MCFEWRRQKAEPTGRPDRRGARSAGRQSPWPCVPARAHRPAPTTIGKCCRSGIRRTPSSPMAIHHRQRRVHTIRRSQPATSADWAQLVGRHSNIAEVAPVEGRTFRRRCWPQTAGEPGQVHTLSPWPSLCQRGPMPSFQSPMPISGSRGPPRSRPRSSARRQCFEQGAALLTGPRTAHTVFPPRRPAAGSPYRNRDFLGKDGSGRGGRPHIGRGWA